MMARQGWVRPLLAVALSAIGAGPVPAIADDAPSDLERKVETRGNPVSVSVTPGCRLGGDDADAKSRVETFMTQARTAVASAVADIEFPASFSGWAAELEVESEAVPPSSRTRRVRIVKSSPSLDLELTRRMLRPSIPGLPNFRANCTFTVRVKPWRTTEPH
jgi:hypothetical protein